MTQNIKEKEFFFFFVFLFFFLPGVIIYLTLFSCQSLRDTLNPDLPLEFLEPECEGSLRIGLNISCFVGCIPIGVDDKATMVELLQVNHTSRNSARGQLCGG